MELTISFVALTISLVTNLILVLNIKRDKFTDLEFVPILETGVGCHCDCAAKIAEAEGTLIPVSHEAVIPVTQDDSYHAWKNRTEEPIKASTSPHHPPPLPGPLERPAGFAR